MFKYEHSALNCFVHAEIDIRNLFLNFEKKSFKFCFYKKVNPGVTYCNNLQKFELQDFIETHIKLRIVLTAVQIFKKNKDKKLLFAFE